MGSVGMDYRCPWCAALAPGAYSMDGIGFPVCNECLDGVQLMGFQYPYIRCANAFAKVCPLRADNGVANGLFRKMINVCGVNVAAFLMQCPEYLYWQ